MILWDTGFPVQRVDHSAAIARLFERNWPCLMSVSWLGLSISVLAGVANGQSKTKNGQARPIRARLSDKLPLRERQVALNLRIFEVGILCVRVNRMLHHCYSGTPSGNLSLLVCEIRCGQFDPTNHRSHLQGSRFEEMLWRKSKRLLSAGLYGKSQINAFGSLRAKQQKRGFVKSGHVYTVYRIDSDPHRNSPSIYTRPAIRTD